MQGVPDNPLITIVIATYNAGKHLQACLTTIMEQAEKNIEVLVTDGGSTDDTIAILKTFEDKLNLSWTSAPDAGIYDAMNKGVQKAKGKWIHFLGADDRLLPGFSQMAALLKDEHTVYYGNSEPYYGNSGATPLLLNGKFSPYRLAKHCMNHQAIIYPAAVFQKYAYNLRYKVFADYALNIQVWGDKTFKKVFQPITIVRYDMTGFSAGGNDVPFKQDKLLLIRRSMGWLIYLRMLYKGYKQKLQGEGDYWRV